MRRVVALAATLIALLLAAFLAFVGWHKTFATLTELAHYGSWTVHLWEPLGRLVGVSEIVCAAALLLPLIRSGAGQIRRWACQYLVANQCIAALFHAAHGEARALPQNAVLIALTVFVLWSSSARRQRGG